MIDERLVIAMKTLTYTHKEKYTSKWKTAKMTIQIEISPIIQSHFNYTKQTGLNFKPQRLTEQSLSGSIYYK